MKNLKLSSLVIDKILYAVLLAALIGAASAPALALNNAEYKSLIEKSAAGDPSAQDTVSAFQGNGNALSVMQKVAKSGDINAQLMLGTIYANDEQRFKPGVPKNIDEAIIWYKRAAEQGNARAQYQLANIYGKASYLSKDSTDDDTEALKWYRKAAEQGHTSAQVQIGQRYYNGKGVPKDYSQAAMWFQRAAKGGEIKAMLYLAYMSNYGQGISQDSELANKWYKEVCTTGHNQDDDGGEGFYLHHISKLVIQEYSSFLRQNLLAASEGNADAQFKLGELFATQNNGLPLDYVESLRWYRKAVEQGHPAALYDLGAMYFNGIGLVQDKVLAYALLSLATTRGIKQGEEARNGIGYSLSHEQMDEAKSIVANWKPGLPFPLESKTGADRVYASIPPAGFRPAVVNESKECMPVYPRESMLKEETGVVTLKFTVSPDDQITSTQLIKSSGFSNLDKAAIDGLSRCKVKSAIKDGKPVQATVTLAYTFSL